MRRLVWFLLVVVVLAVVADRGGAFIAERVVADDLQTSQGLPSEPDVDITGFPFLTQFASGRYEHVRATATEVPVAKTSLRLSRLTVSFRGVTASRDFHRFTARTGTATALVSYDDLSSALGTSIGYDGSGRISAERTVTVLGKQVRPSISVQPRLVDGALTFVGARIDGVQDLPSSVQSALEDVFTRRLSLGGLPFDIRVTGVRVDSDGITLRLTGRDLRYVARAAS